MSISNVLAAATLAVLANAAIAQCSCFANTPPGTNLALTDEGVRTVGLPFTFTFNNIGYTRITVSSNGFVWLGDSTLNDFSPTAAEALSGAPRIMPLWWDLNPGSTAVQVGGGVFYSADATQACVTWKGIPQFGSTTLFANFELILSANGNIAFYYDTANGIPTTTNTVVGVTRGGAATPNPLDWSVALPVALIAGATATEQFTSPTATTPIPFDLNNRNGAGLGTTIVFTATSTTDYAAADSSNFATCTPSTPLPLAGTVSTSGVGCPKPRIAIYELFTSNTGTNPIDLSNTSVQFVKSGNDYSMVPGPGFDPTYNVGGTILAGVGDDTTTTVSLAAGMGTFQLGTNTAITSVQVGSNGSIGLPTVATTANPSAATFHTAGARASAAWMDLVPNTTTAPIYVENTASFFRATWQAVPAFTDGGSYTFQITLLPSGDVILSYLGMSGGPTRTCLAGLVGSATPTNIGSQNLFTAGVPNAISGQITGVGAVPMPHTVNAAPRLGQNFVMSASVPANNVGIGVFIIGSAVLNAPLDSVFGAGSAPGCFIYTDILIQFVPLFTPGNTTFSETVPMPYDINLSGLALRSQAAVFTGPGVNAANLITSNALSWTSGL